MKELLYYLALIYYNVEFLLTRCIKSRHEGSVLLLRMDNIGDFLIWLDASKEFKNFINEKIVLLCRPSVASIAKKLPYFDEIITFDDKKLFLNPFYRLSFYKKMCSRKFDAVYNPMYSRDYFVIDLLVRNIKAKHKVGFKGDYFNTVSRLKGLNISLKKREKVAFQLKQKADKYYNQLINYDSSGKMEMQVDAEFIRRTINKDYSSHLYNWTVDLPKVDNLPDDYIVVFIGASKVEKIWNREKFAHIINSTKNNVVVCGGKGDINIWNDIKPLVKRSCTDMVGNTTLLDLFYIIKNSKYIITNDTSASHIAPIMRTPCVVIVPSAYIGRFHPYKVDAIDNKEEIFLPKPIFHIMDCSGCRNICKYNEKTYPCISMIDEQQVKDKIDEIERELTITST